MVEVKINLNKILLLCNLTGVIIFTLIIGDNLVPLIWEYLGHVWAVITGMGLALSAYFLIYGMLWEYATNKRALE